MELIIPVTVVMALFALVAARGAGSLNGERSRDIQHALQWMEDDLRTKQEAARRARLAAAATASPVGGPVRMVDPPSQGYAFMA